MEIFKDIIEYVPIIISVFTLIVVIIKSRGEVKKTEVEADDIEADTLKKYIEMTHTEADARRQLKEENELLWDENRTLKRRFNVLENQFLDVEQKLKSMKEESDKSLADMMELNKKLREYNCMLAEKLAMHGIPVPEFSNG